jgi:hypothetical protein
VAQRDPEVRAAVADGLEDGRKLWARLLYGVDDADEEKTRASPSAAELARGMQAICDQIAS